jgi:hypothetical protein
MLIIGAVIPANMAFLRQSMLTATRFFVITLPFYFNVPRCDRTLTARRRQRTTAAFSCSQLAQQFLGSNSGKAKEKTHYGVVRVFGGKMLLTELSLSTQ